MLNEAVDLVIDFQKLAGQPVATYPRQLEQDRVRIRAKWISEEIEEFRNAKNIREQLDALTDTLYYLLGCFAEIGVYPDEPFCIIHKSNLKKVLMNAKIEKDSDTKVLKPSGWIHPDDELQKYIDSQCQK